MMTCSDRSLIECESIRQKTVVTAHVDSPLLIPKQDCIYPSLSLPLRNRDHLLKEIITAESRREFGVLSAYGKVQR